MQVLGGSPWDGLDHFHANGYYNLRVCARRPAVDLESDFVCDRCGRRFIAAWRDDAERRASRTPRVRVAARQLDKIGEHLDRQRQTSARVRQVIG
jgi:hypothetical protein